MPISRYLKLIIGNKQVQVTDPAALPISIDYALEDPENFQNKDSGMALDVEVPATLMNDVAANTFRNPDIADFTEGNIFRSNQQFVLDENGFEILSGKAFLTSASHDSKPLSYRYNLYGDNADWKISLEESTLYDFLKDVQFTFEKDIIQNSWNYDWQNPESVYVFVPIRYRAAMGGYKTIDGVDTPDDTNMIPEYMKPSISKYYILYQAFKSLGYKIQSNFFDSEYFRRQLMPWTWGNFLTSDGTKMDIHKFMAKSTESTYYSFGRRRHSNFFIDLKVEVGPEGTFDNNNNYHYDSANQEMVWEYTAPDYGLQNINLSMQLYINARLNGGNSFINCKVIWYKNGDQKGESPLVDLGNGVFIGGDDDIGLKEVFFKQDVKFGDRISAKIQLDGFESAQGFTAFQAEVMHFQTDFFRIPIKGTIFFSNYTGLKNYKFLDYLRGLIAEFNLSINTDAINRIVTIEPTHPYAVINDLSQTLPGYFVDDFITWDGKEDLSKKWTMNNYNDYNRELTFKYKDDSNDGMLKLIQDRNTLVLASGKYVFPPRFKTGKKVIENPFFAATMHYNVDQWKNLGTGVNAGISPQMICMIPENVSNTSNDESSNTFIPKSIYYKGNVAGAGAWKFDGVVYQTFPFAFAVNYQQNGQNDPILSYSDENINGVIGKGLLKRFYWQRLAIMRNGQWYSTWFRLKNVDVVNCLHREYKSYKGQRWELVTISGYKPLQEGSTGCLLRKWAPISIEDFNSTFPSAANVIDNSGTNSLDIKYNKLMALFTDIPV